MTGSITRGFSLVMAALVVLSSPLARAVEDELSPGSTLTLRHAIRLALEYSPQLQAGKEKLVQAQTQVKMAWSFFLPYVAAGGTYTRADEEIALDFGALNDLSALAIANCFDWDEGVTGMARPALCDNLDPSATGGDSGSGARVMQELNNWDANIKVGISLLNARLFPQIRNIYAGEEIARLQHAFSEEQLVFAVVQLYYGVATSQATTRLVREQLATAIRHRELTEVRGNAGVALPNEKVRADMAVLQAEGSLEQAELGAELSRRALAVFTGLDHADYSVEESPVHPWDAPLTLAVDTSVLSRRKDLLMLGKMQEIADRNITDAQLRFLPTVQGVWNWSWSSNTGFAGRNSQWKAMVTLNWSIFEGGFRKFQLDEARSKLREIRFNRAAAMQAAENESFQAVHQVKAARSALAVAQASLELSVQNLSIVEKQYKLGVAQQTTLLDAELQDRLARIQVIANRLRLALAELSYTRATGRMTLDRLPSHEP